MSAASYLLIMLVWLAFDAALGVVLLASDPKRTPGQVAGTAILSVMRLLLVALTAMQLGGCGGGDWPEEGADVPRPGVDCQARPELCA
jgi:hypothetical protein